MAKQHLILLLGITIGMILTHLLIKAPGGYPNPTSYKVHDQANTPDNEAKKEGYTPDNEAKKEANALAGKYTLNIYQDYNLSQTMHDAQLVFANLVTTKTAKCMRIKRFGKSGDGGYELCLDDLYKPDPKSCIIYSFGIGKIWSFDDAMQKHGCEVHSFDPSINKEDHVRNPNHYFHNLGLWGSDIINEKGWKMQTLGTIMKNLNHQNRVIDAIKIDIEGSEWPFLQYLLTTQLPKQVKQLIFEIHTPTRKPQPMTVGIFATITKDIKSLMENFGYGLYHVLHNNGCCGPFSTLTESGVKPGLGKLCCYELYFVNTRINEYSSSLK